MKPSRSSRRWIVPALLATASLTAVLMHEDIPGFSFGRQTKQAAAPTGQASFVTSDSKTSDRTEDASPESEGSESSVRSDQSSNISIVKNDKAAGPLPGGAARLFDRTFKLKQWGREANWALALDEISVVDSVGKEHVYLLQPPATPETYEARIAEYANQGRVLPVVYPEGEERNAGNRMLVTEDVMVRVPQDADRNAIVSTLDLATKALPSWSPHLALVSADSPLAALDAIDKLRENSELADAQVMLATQMNKRAMPNDPQINKQWHLKYNSASGVIQGTDINVESVWNYPEPTGIRGTGVVVGVVDDGLQTNHPDFVGNINTLLDWDFNGGANGDDSPMPEGDDNHGTACAGDVGARGNNDTGVCGSAPEATLVGYRLIAGPVSDFDIADAISYENQNVHIKSNSWGPPDAFLLKTGAGEFAQAALQSSVTQGRGNKGTVFLWAGGNGDDYGDNSNYDSYANDIRVIGVGAMDSMMRKSWYSEFGANLLVTAPSNGDSPARGKTTTDRTGSAGYSTTSDYTDTFGGTSSATPTTAGVVALILQANPNLTYRDVQEILATSAKKINPNDAGWVTNSAGFHFHHAYGAGLVDAGAAVALAQNWTNLGANVSENATLAEGGGQIPENTASGLVRTFDLSDSEVRAEHVTVTVDISHSSRGNLEITLTSPSGVTSRLAERHGDRAANYNWTFMTTHNWGERSTGTWTLKVADRSGDSNTTGGVLNSATLTIQGSVAAPLNPAPVVQITSPANGSTFTPGSTVPVTVSATDLDDEGNPGVVTKVELFDNGTLVGTDTTEPYTFEITPTDGAHALVAKATDDAAPEPGVGESGAVNIEMRNTPPVITAASIGYSLAYSDTALSVSGLASTDQDGDAPSFAYLWQKSSDGRTFTDVLDKTTATLPAAPENAGLLWRCKITPSDTHNTGVPFLTNVVNVVTRPQTLVAPGAGYNYQSGLVMKNNGSPIIRDAIINEFSQGPVLNGVSGYSEWVEILTLRSVSLRNWSIKESSGLRVTFANAAVWDNVPAGTRIVIYNGSVTKDASLPADDTNHSDRVVVIPHTNTTYFTAGGTWPALANTGDVLSLRSPADAMVSEVGFGLLSGGFINIGEVESQQAAYYTGNSDEGSNVPENWLVTDSMIARTDISPRAAGDLIISQYILGGISNDQDRAIEIFNPTSVPVDLAASQYSLTIHALASTTASHTMSLTGTIPAGGTFVARRANANSALHIPGREQTSNQASFTWSGDDAIILRKSGQPIDAIGKLGTDPGTGWASGSNNTYNFNMVRKSTILIGDSDPNNEYGGAALAEWDFVNRSTLTGIGTHNTTPKFFNVSASPTTFVENAGAGASTGTITLPQNAAANVVFTLTSNKLDTVTVPATATVLAGTSSITFPITAIDDLISDGPQIVAIQAVADGYQTASVSVNITDNEVSIIGVTPGKGNNVANSEWIADLAAGIEDAPSVFRLAAGSTLPAGLTLNTSTGLISGTVNAAAAGTYNVVIERYNADGDVRSQSYALTVGTELTYASWVSGFPGLSSTDPEADPESDGLKNVLEYYLALNPGASNGEVLDTERTETALSITFRRAKGISGVTGAAQWSDELGVTWSSTGITEQILEQTATDELVKASIAVTPADTKKFIRLQVIQNP